MLSKRILTMQDLSCVGQCSLTVALPILSARGVETCVLPTAVLSNHTMFKSWTYRDLAPEMDDIFAKWEENGINFDGFYLGYLGKTSLMPVAKQCFKKFATPNAMVIIDPAFGDNGKLYGGFDAEYVAAMKDLLKEADVILPNLTEACYLTGEDYREEYDLGYIEDIIKKLREDTGANVIMTGVEHGGKIGEAIYDGNGFKYVFAEKLPVRYHGTGDIFASVFTADYINGASYEKACEAAGKFVADCIRRTDDGHFYGVNFESVLCGK